MSRVQVCLCLLASSGVALAQPVDLPPTVLSDDTPVRIPWSEVRALLARNRQAHPTPPPQTFALGAARADAELANRDLSVRLTIPVVLLDDAWAAVPLWRSAVTLRRATLDGKPAAFAVDGDQLVLVTRGRGSHTLFAELAVPLGATGSQASVPFAVPVAVTWHVSLPGTDARIEPSVRQKVARGGGRVTLDALTPPSGSVQIDWSGDRGTAVPERLTAESLTFVTFQEGTTSGRARFSFEISGGSRERLSILVPANLEVLSAMSTELADWTVESADGHRRWIGHFRRPQRGRVEVDLSFELPKGEDTAELPRLSAEDVSEQRAYVAATSESPMSIEPVDAKGGEAIDARSLPTYLLRGVRAPFTLAYRHDGSSFAARVRIDRHATVALAQATIDAAYFTSVLTDDGQEVMKATFLVKNNLRPYLGLTLPQGATLWAAFVSGESVNPASEGAQLLLPLVKSRELGTGDTIAVHRVTAGYTLGDIALQYYHDASKWKLIQKENEGILNGNPQAQIGQALRIPRLSGPAGSDLSTAFPVEVVYSRPAPKPGTLGAATFEGPVADLDVMKVVWTVYLPSRVDPLRFGGNLTQTSYVRYGLLRRLATLTHGTWAAELPAFAVPSAYAGEGSLRARFAGPKEFEDASGEMMSHPHEVLPLVGRGYVFKKFLQEREAPRLSAVYLDRRFEAPVRWLAFALGLVLALLVARSISRRVASVVVFAAVAPLFGVVALVGGHYVLGTHARALMGVLFGAWVWLIVELFARKTVGGLAQRALGRGVRGVNVAALLVVLAAGAGPGTVLLALLCIGAGVWFLLRKPARAAAPVAAALLFLAVPTARAQGVPSNAEVTLPFGKLKDLLGEPGKPPPPPRDHSLLSADYSAHLAGESLEVDGTVELEVHGDGWVQVPLIPADEALTSLTLDGKPFAASTAGGGFLAVLRGAGQHRLQLSFVAPMREQGAATLGLVPGVASTLRVALPSAGLEPEVTGATEVRVAGPNVTALVPPSAGVQLRWSTHVRAPQEPGQVEAELRMVARTLQIVSIDEHRTYAQVRYQIQRGSTRAFSLQLPEDVELIDVQGEGLEQHQVSTIDGKRVLSVTTQANVRNELELSFAYDWKEPVAGKPLPTFQVRGVRSETGTLGIEASQRMEIQLASVDRAAAIDVRAAPELFQHTDKPIVHAIRYLQQPYSVRVSLVQHPEVTLETATVDDARYTTVVSDDGRAITEGQFKLRNARRAFLGVSLPPSSDIESVLIAGVPAKPVRDAKGTLLLPLMRSPSNEREMQQFDVEVVYLTHLGPAPRVEALRAVLPTVDLRISKVSWELYLPPGRTLVRAPKTEAASDSMQWATAPRAIIATAARPAGGEVVATGGILPVRFNLPTHGEPQRFHAYYLPSSVAPQFDAEIAAASISPVAAIAVAALLAALAAGWLLSRRRH
jgi:nucleoid-associated protein YgaU